MGSAIKTTGGAAAAAGTPAAATAETTSAVAREEEEDDDDDDDEEEEQEEEEDDSGRKRRRSGATYRTRYSYVVVQGTTCYTTLRHVTLQASVYCVAVEYNRQRAEGNANKDNAGQKTLVLTRVTLLGAVPLNEKALGWVRHHAPGLVLELLEYVVL